MTLTRLILHSLRYYWRTNVAVMLGVAAAVAVLAGALLVGDSVRGSLRDLALGRLGRTDSVISSLGFFRRGSRHRCPEGAVGVEYRLAHRRRRVRHARILRPAGGERARLRRRRAVLELQRHRAARRRLRLACPGRRGWRERRGRPADAPAEAVRDSDRVAVRQEGGCREDGASHPGWRPAAGPAGRVRAQAAADRGAGGVRAAAPHPARPCRRRAGQHHPDRGRGAERVEAARRGSLVGHRRQGCGGGRSARRCR